MRVVLFAVLIFISTFDLQAVSSDKSKQVAMLQNIDQGSEAYQATKKKQQDDLNKANRKIVVDDLELDTREFIARISKVNSYRADFIQSEQSEQSEQFNRSNRTESKQLKGTLKLARPGKFLWTITSPEKEKQSYITNGTKFWHYDVGLEQVVVDKFDVKKIAHSPFYLLLDDIYNIATNYKITKVSENTFKMVPKIKADNYMTDLKIAFSDAKSGAIKKISFLAAEHKRITVELTNVVVNSSIGSNVFNFVPPKGVDVITSDEIM